MCYGDKNNLAVCRVLDNQQVPRFNSFVYDSTQHQIGKIEEVFGPLSGFFVAFKGINGYSVESISKQTQFGLRTGQLIPVQKFKPVPKVKQYGKPKDNKPKNKDFRSGNSRFGGPQNRGNRFDNRGGNGKPRFDGNRGGSRFGDRPQGNRFSR